MKKSKYFKSFMSFLLILSAVCSMLCGTASAASDPEILANAAVLYEMNTGDVLYRKNEGSRLAPASTTKIMTALLAVEAYEAGEIDLEDVITAPADLYFDVTADGSTQGIKAGEELRFEDLLYCILLSSANEACNVVAAYISGSVSAFVEEMNARAAALGCTDTHFANTHGMPNDAHYTTAWDLCLIAEEAMSHPAFEKIASATSWKVPATNLSEARDIVTTNKLLLKNSEYYYEYALGVKTGYTDTAGYCLVSAAEQEGVRLLSVVMGAQSVQTEDGRTQVQSFSESQRLFAWGFSNFSYRVILDTTTLLSEMPVLHGDGADVVLLRPEKQITAFLDNEILTESFNKTVTLYYPTAEGEQLSAPVSAGTVLGEVSLYYGGELYGTVNLVANTSVDLQRLSFVKYEITRVLSSTWMKLLLTVVVLIFVLYFAFIIRYNIVRSRKKKAEKEAAYRRAEELKMTPTMGKSIEDIESIYVSAGQNRE